MELQVGVKILLKNKEGKFLLVRRNPKKYPEVGPKWDIIGGRIEPGASLMGNLRHEIKEEVSLDYQGEPKIDDDHLEVKWFSGGEIKKMGETELDLFFKELLDKGKISI